MEGRLSDGERGMEVTRVAHAGHGGEDSGSTGMPGAGDSQAPCSLEKVKEQNCLRLENGDSDSLFKMCISV